MIDAATIDGSALLSAMPWQFNGAGQLRDAPGENLLYGGARLS